MKHRLVEAIQKNTYAAVNSFELKGSEREEAFACGTVFRDLCYGRDYPNSYLDLYKSQKGKSAPLIFYVHGGGFTWGSKEDGDPNAGEQGDKMWFFKRFLEEGYDVVSIDYAFAPEYSYPTPILQMRQAMRFLEANAATYALAMDQVILCGSSAGGQIVGQYALIETDAAYAGSMQIEPVLSKGAIRCILFNSALLDPTRYDKVHDLGFNYLLRKCGQAYYKERVMRTAKGAIEGNILSHVTKSYPPSFLSDANTGSFYDQARDMYAKLQDLGVTTRLNIYDRHEAKLKHGYESFDTVYGQDNMEQMLAFIKENL